MDNCEVFFGNIQFLFVIIVFVASILSMLQIASLLSFSGVLVLFMIPNAIVPIATIFYLSMNITKLYIFRKEINWKLVFKLVLTSIPGLAVGTALITFISQNLVSRIISIFIIIFLLSEIFKINKFNIKNTSTAIVLVGSGYGFLSGLLGSGSIIRTPLLMKMNLSKGAFIGTAAAASLFSNIIKIISYSASGLMTKYVITNGIIAIIVGIIGTQIGKKILIHVNDLHFKIILQIGLLISSIYGLRLF